MKIGNFETENNVFLAPMAGVTDLPFRKICRRYGAGLVYSEMVSAKGLYYNDKKTAAPPCSIIFATSTAFILSSSQPLRIFTVTGTGDAGRVLQRNGGLGYNKESKRIGFNSGNRQRR